MSKYARRSFLKWISGLLAAGNAAIVGIPVLSYGVGSLRSQESPQAKLRRVARLGEIPTGRPVLVPIIGDFHDAWTLHPSEPIGRAWLIRGAIDPKDPANTSIKALSAVCPHLGCTIQLASDSKRYVCPCHLAAYALDGQRVGDLKTGRPSHAPRSMDALECRVVQDESSTEWWVEVRYEEFEQGLTTSIATA